jgi:hypothetical protein
MPKGIRLFFTTIKEAVHGLENITFPVNYVRSLFVKTTATDNLKNLQSFFCVLIDIVRTKTIEKNGWVNTHKLTDSVHAAGTASRSLMLFVRIITGAFVRDYIIGRFLKARSELVLKSCITREIVLESRIY